MRTYTQEELNYLIKCEKTITSPPKKVMTQDKGHYRNSMLLQSKDGVNNFSLFIRKNVKFEENFSIGLVYHPKDGSEKITIFRCNGPHGIHVNDFMEGKYHDSYHIHIAKDFNINAGKKSDLYAKSTQDYINLNEAILYCIKYCNIENADNYFNLDNGTQLTLLDEGLSNGG